MGGNSEDKVPGAGQVLYPHNELDGFSSGCLLDLRVRLAAEFLKGPMFTKPDTMAPGMMVNLALTIADELLTQGAAQGWVTPFPAGGELSQRMRDQAKLSASFQTLVQLESQKFAQRENESAIVPAPPMIHRKLDS